ncbi:hypothetical protein M7I_4077 [Glarea lozoyensis 74030]|uniref:Uncharacterized protein n=1 Tax=Glarea lozoyensis (strain ATCC 74030 / MF5533) TaxID=1104152 RepID=H0EN74_GLAL7|nr:hypothetical protein M7I_4077 [Glarea lozoyensis 74030]
MALFASTFRWLQRKRYQYEHITFLTSRAWFYYNGDESAKMEIANSSASTVMEVVKETVAAVQKSGGREVVEGVKEL